MKPGMRRALARLEALLDDEELASGLEVRVHGDHLILSRDEEADSGEVIADDRVRLTKVGAAHWGLSVKRHTGRWEQTPYVGTMEEMVDAMMAFMQHLIAPY